MIDNNDISLSVKFVSCNEAKTLLNGETNKPVGYEIESLVNNNPSIKNFSFAEIIDKDLRDKNEFALPFAEKSDDRFVIKKQLLYKNFTIRNEEAA